MAIKRTTKVDAGFSMSSMTDIVFLLLIFFLVTSTLINPNALKLLLPKSTGQVSSKALVSVSIMNHPEQGICTYHINGSQESIPFNNVEDAIVSQLQGEEKENQTFSIYADETVPFGEVVAVMNIAKRNHYKVIAATRPE